MKTVTYKVTYTVTLTEAEEQKFLEEETLHSEIAARLPDFDTTDIEKTSGAGLEIFFAETITNLKKL